MKITIDLSPVFGTAGKVISWGIIGAAFVADVLSGPADVMLKVSLVIASAIDARGWLKSFVYGDVN